MTSTPYAPDPPMWTAPTVPRPRARALRLPVLPSGALLAQIAGGVSTLAGLYLTVGIGVTMIVGGITAAVLGALREAGKV